MTKSGWYFFPTPVYIKNVIVDKLRYIYYNVFQAPKTINVLYLFLIFIELFEIYLFVILVVWAFKCGCLWGMQLKYIYFCMG